MHKILYIERLKVSQCHPELAEVAIEAQAINIFSSLSAHAVVSNKFIYCQMLAHKCQLAIGQDVELDIRFVSYQGLVRHSLVFGRVCQMNPRLYVRDI